MSGEAGEARSPRGTESGAGGGAGHDAGGDAGGVATGVNEALVAALSGIAVRPGGAIHGVGVDVAVISRVRRLYERYGDRFLRRTYTEGERRYALEYRDPAPSLAARWAAKEAALKALGAGMAPGMTWRDFEVVRHGGPPRIVFGGIAGDIARRAAVGPAHLALTHDGDLAVAFVVLERGPLTPGASERPTERQADREL